MSSGVEHRDDTAINREEHIAADGQQTRKAVGLFARDALGNGTLELSALSTASGAVLSTTPASISANVAIANVTLNPGPNHIGSVTIFGTVQATPGMTTLFPGPNYIGLVTATVANTVGNATLNPSPNQIGSVTVANTVGISAPTLFAVVNTGAVGNTNSLATLLSGPNQIGSVTVSNFTAPNLGNVTINPGSSQIGSVTVSNWVSPNLGNVTLNPSPSFIGIVTVANPTSAAGMTTLFPGPNQIGSVTIANQQPLVASSAFIGLVTVANTIPVTGTFWQNTQPVSFSNVTLNAGISQIGSVTVSNPVQLASGTNFIGLATVTTSNPGAAGMTTLFPGPNQIGSVTVSNTVTVSQTGLTSLASGTEVRSLATLLNMPALTASSAYIGLVTASIVGSVNTGMLTIFPGPNQIGSVTISNNPTLGTGANYIGLVTASIVGSVNTGMLTIFPGPNQIGSVTVSNFPATQPVSFNQLVSLASGTNVGLNAGSNYIGLATVNVANTVGNATLNPSPNQIGSVTVSNPVQLATGSSFIGLATVTITNSINVGMTTLFGGPNQIGSVTISNTPSVAQSGNWDIRSVLSLASIYGNVGIIGTPTVFVGTPTLFAVVNTGAVGNTNSLATLLSGPNQIGSVTVSNFVAPNVGNVTLNPSPNYIGLVTIGHIPFVQGDVANGSADSGNPLKVGGFARPQTVLASTASGNRVNAWFDNSGLQGFFGFATIYPRTDYIGLMSVSGNVAVSNFVSPNIGNVTLNGSPNFIGLVTVANTVPVTGTFWQATQPVSFGNSTINPGPNQIGSVTISNNPTLGTGSNFIGLATVTMSNSINVGMTTLFGGPNQIGSVTVSNFTAPNVGNVTLNSSPNYIGLVTTYQGRSATTLFAGYVSASGYSTIFVPPSGQRFFIHSVLVNSKGNADGFIGSSTNAMIPWTSLATYGGFPYQHETPGLPAFAVDQSMTFRQYSLVTLSYTVSTHFE